MPISFVRPNSAGVFPSWLCSCTRFRDGENTSVHLGEKVCVLARWSAPRILQDSWISLRCVARGWALKITSTRHPSMRFWDGVRQKFSDSLRGRASRLKQAPLLEALLIGNNQRLTERDWRIFRATGTNHLVAISGLHVGIVAGLFYRCFFVLWGWIPRLPNYCPSPVAARLASYLMAIFYSGLAGFLFRPVVSYGCWEFKCFRNF